MTETKKSSVNNQKSQQKLEKEEREKQSGQLEQTPEKHHQPQKEGEPSEKKVDQDSSNTASTKETEPDAEEIGLEESKGSQEGESSGEESREVIGSEKIKALNDKYLRLYAEFDNFRKRSAKESLDLIQTANSDLLTKLLPTLEHFEIAFAPEQKAKKLEDFEPGIKMIFNSFKDALEEAGLEEINPVGEEFDPTYHEAMLEQYHDTVEEGNIIQVYQKGYKVKSKILKHAKVIISKGKKE